MKGEPEVVISGIGGVFPESVNLTEFKEKLYAGINMVTDQDRRWPIDNLGVPTALGKVPGRDEFDHGMFYISSKMADILNPNFVRSMESAFTAFVDAGLNPNDLSGTNTACICGLTNCEYEFDSLLSSLQLLGNSRTMQANRISFAFNLLGPSYPIQSSFESCITAVFHAKNLIQRGEVEAAIVTVSNIARIETVPYPFYRTGALSEDGTTKCFSNDANGYARAEGTLSLFLQKKENALRSYGTVLGASVDFVGSKDGYFLDLARGSFPLQLRNMYSKSRIDPSQIKFVECAGVASLAKDAEELNSLDEVFKPRREDPLLVGSVKSNVGHAEGCADGLAVLKALLTLDSGIIPPNLHYTSPNTGVPALLDGRIKVVTKCTDLEGDLVGVNAIDVTSTFRHGVFKQHAKTRTYKAQVGVLPPDGIPRLFFMTGRNTDKVTEAIKKVERMPVDPYFLGLAQKVFKKGIKNHFVRGFTVLNDRNIEKREVQEFNSNKTAPVWWVFTGMGSQWNEMGTDLLRLPVFAKSIGKCHEILKPKGLDLYNIITSKDKTMFDNILHSFVGIASIQIGLVDVLREIGVTPDGLIGHSVGETACAYADGCLTAEETILAAYARGKASHEAKLIPGMMAAIGAGYESIKDSLPNGIDVACHNSSDNCTISGPAQEIKDFVDTLEKKTVFCRMVNVSNIAYHSRYIQPAAPLLLRKLKEVIKTPKMRSSKWISTSVPKEKWDSDEAKYCSAEYLTNNLLSSVLFEEGSAFIPKDAIIVEVSPHGLLQAILKRSFRDASHVPLTRRGDPDNLVHLMAAFGSLYNRGLVLDIEKLYPSVDFPVPRDTPSLDILVTWERHPTFLINDKSYQIGEEDNGQFCKKEIVNFNQNWKHLNGYILNGIQVVPPSLYMSLILAFKKPKTNVQNYVVQIKNMVVTRTLEVFDGCATLNVEYLPGNGKLEVSSEVGTVCTLEINEDCSLIKITVPKIYGRITPGTVLYEYLENAGIELDPSFKLIKHYEESDTVVKAKIRWTGYLENFIEAALHIPVYSAKVDNNLNMVKQIDSVTIDFSKFSSEEEKDLTVYYFKTTQSIFCDGLEVRGVVLQPIAEYAKPHIKLQKPSLLPYNNTGLNTLNDLLSYIKEIIFSRIMINSGEKTVHVYLCSEYADVQDEVVKVFENNFEIKVHVMLMEERDSFLVNEMNTTKGNVLIVAGHSSVENAVKVLKNSQDGYILLWNTTVPPELTVVCTATLDNKEYSLCRYKIHDVRSIPQFSVGSGNWEVMLKKSLNDPNTEVVFAILPESVPSKVLALIRKCSQFNNSYKISYICYDKSSDFSISSHLSHLQKGLKTNILKNKEWFTISLNNVNYNNVPSVFINRPAFKYSQITTENVDIAAFGLSLGGFNKSKQTDILEYSGNESGREVCGIGLLREDTKTFEPDQILKWEKPKNWSHEDVASVLIPYALAEIIVNRYSYDACKLHEYNSILCLHGIHPVSQAVMNLCLMNRYKVYTTFADENEKAILKSLYPEIPDGNLVSSENLAILTDYIRKKEPVGLPYIFNPLPDEKVFHATYHLMGTHSNYFQMSFDENSCNKPMGMRHYLTYIAAVFGVNPTILLCLNDHHKEEIQESLQSAFDQGHVRPIAYVKTGFGSPNYGIVDLLSGSDCCHKRQVVSKTARSDTALKNQWFVGGDNDSVLFIVLVGSSKWAGLLEWFVNRNIGNVYLLISEENMSSTISIKISVLVKRNPNVAVYLNSSTNFSTNKSLAKHIHSIKSNSNLRAVVVCGEERADRLKTINESATNSKLLYLTPTLDSYLMEQKHSVLQINYDKDMSLECDSLLPVMDELLMIQDNVLIQTQWNTRRSSCIEVDETLRAYNLHLPLKMTELLVLGREARTTRWEEVRTSSPRYEKCTSNPPIFIIPPLKKGAMDRFYSNLMSPAFLARIAPHSGRESVVHQLAQNIEIFNIGVITLVCSEWSTYLGLALSKELEQLGKQVTLVVFESSISFDPEEVIYVTKRKVTCEIQEDPNYQQIENKIESSLKILKDLINLSTEEDVISAKKFSGLLVLLKSNNSKNHNLAVKLQEHCERTINMVTTNERDCIEMVNSKEVGHLINSISLTECRDSANRIQPSYSVFTTHRELVLNQDKHTFSIDNILDSYKVEHHKWWL